MHSLKFKKRIDLKKKIKAIEVQVTCECGKNCKGAVQMNKVWELGSRARQTQSLPLRSCDLELVA